MIAPFSTFAGFASFGHNFAPELGFVKIVIVSFDFFPLVTQKIEIFSLVANTLPEKYNDCYDGGDVRFTVRNLLTI